MDFQKDKVQKMLGTGNEKKSLIKTFFLIMKLWNIESQRKFLNGV